MRNSERRKGGILGALLVTVAVLVCIGLVIGLTVARNVRVQTGASKSGENVLIQTPVGELSIRAKDHGSRSLNDIPAYPGARRKADSGGGAVFKWTPSDGDGGGGLSVGGEESITNDSVEDVVAFYKAQLKSWIVSEDKGGEVRLELDKGGLKRFVVVSAKADGTHIGVASIGEAASN